jgi:preprotein translocase subunit SecD
VTLEPPHRYAIESTSLTQDSMGYPAVGFELASSNKTDFERWTGGHVGRNMVILIDGKVVTMATLRSALPGAGVITSAAQEPWTEDQARELANRIAPMK